MNILPVALLTVILEKLFQRPNGFVLSGKKAAVFDGLEGFPRNKSDADFLSKSERLIDALISVSAPVDVAFSEEQEGK